MRYCLVIERQSCQQQLSENIMSYTPIKKDLVYMNDEQLEAAGFGFLTENPRVKVMPEVGVTFNVEWSTNEFYSVTHGNVHQYQRVKHERVGEVLFVGKDLAVLLCSKTAKRV